MDFKGDQIVPTNLVSLFLSIFDDVYYKKCWFTTILLLWNQFLLQKCRFIVRLILQYYNIVFNVALLFY